MFTVGKLQRKPKHFKSFTGLNPDEFNTLLQAVQLEYQTQDQNRKTLNPRKRAPGAGRKFKLEISERLLMTLMYYRLHLTFILLGYLFDLDDTRAGEEVRERMEPVLLEVLPIPMRDRFFEPFGQTNASSSNSSQGASNQPRIRTLEELLIKHPELEELLIDATEQEVPRPENKGKRRTRYSGKKKVHTIKTQVVTSKKVILHVSESIDGSVSDLRLLRASGVMHSIPKDRKVRCDRGYEGIEAEYPESLIEKPIREQGNHKVTVLGKIWNRLVSKERIAVEHVLCRLEKFKVLAGKYRARLGGYEDRFAVVAGLVNFKALDRLSWS